MQLSPPTRFPRALVTHAVTVGAFVTQTLTVCPAMLGDHKGLLEAGSPRTSIKPVQILCACVTFPGRRTGVGLDKAVAGSKKKKKALTKARSGVFSHKSSKSGDASMLLGPRRRPSQDPGPTADRAPCNLVQRMTMFSHPGN